LLESKMSRVESLFEELERVYELNIRLVENMQATLMWIVEYSKETGIEIPKLDTLARLVREADRLTQAIKNPLVPEHRFIKPLKDDVTESEQNPDSARGSGAQSAGGGIRAPVYQYDLPHT